LPLHQAGEEILSRIRPGDDAVDPFGLKICLDKLGVVPIVFEMENAEH
jgi:hypothetical protein